MKKETKPAVDEAETTAGPNRVEAPREGSTYYQLIVSSRDAITEMKLVPGRSYTIGRAPECAIIINDPSVSRRHATLEIRDEGVWLRDHGSRNGTRIGGRPVEPNAIVPMATDSVVQTGSATLILQPPRKPHDAGKGGEAATPTTAGVAGRRRIVADPTLQSIYAMVDLVAPTMLGVLILGETGVGKEVFAHEVHRRSPRAAGPFVQLNCAALPESLLEAELFGYEKGAFTGATAARAGLFEAAHKGTVFLDEVGDMPLATQAKMLRFLESGEILPLGSSKPRRVDVRIISATNRDLNAAMMAGAFRTDLYFRLNGMTFTIPPLRRRKADIKPLAEMFAEVAAQRLNRPTPRLSPAVIELLEQRPWIGNVRELKNVVERAVVISGALELQPEHFADSTFTDPTPLPDVSADEITGRFTVVPPSERDLATVAPSLRGDLGSEVRELEMTRVAAALAACGGNQSQAARQLGISRAVLLNRMKLFGLAKPRKRGSGPPNDDDDDPKT